MPMPMPMPRSMLTMPTKRSLALAHVIHRQSPLELNLSLALGAPGAPGAPGASGEPALGAHEGALDTARLGLHAAHRARQLVRRGRLPILVHVSARPRLHVHRQVLKPPPLLPPLLLRLAHGGHGRLCRSRARRPDTTAPASAHHSANGGGAASSSRSSRSGRSGSGEFRR